MIYVHGILGKMAYTVVNLSTTVEECQLLPCENADLVRLIEVTGGVSPMSVGFTHFFAGFVLV